MPQSPSRAVRAQILSPGPVHSDLCLMSNLRAGIPSTQCKRASSSSVSLTVYSAFLSIIALITEIIYSIFKS